jgi:hypothetical protein
MVRCLVYLFLFLPWIGFAQQTSFEAPEKLSNSINSQSEELAPLISADGKTLYFSRLLSNENQGGKYAGADVYSSTRDEATQQWSNAKNSFSFNNKGHNVVVGQSNDGSTLYLIDSSPNKKINGIYFTKQTNTGWTTPELIPIEGLDVQGFFSAYVSPELDVIIMSFKGPDSRGEEDLYFSIKDSSGKWMKPKNMGTTINSKGYETSPFLTKDKKRLYFSSDGHPGHGKADIFYADRLYDSWEMWSLPKNLGENVNSSSFDGYFSLESDSIGYFVSNRGAKSMDVYRVKVNVQNQQVIDSQVRKLIEESKKLLDQVREGTGKQDANLAPIKLAFKGTTITAMSRHEIVSVVEEIKNAEVNVIIVGKDIPELKSLNFMRATSVKDELVLMGVDESRIFTPEGSIDNAMIKERLAQLGVDEILLVFWR